MFVILRAYLDADHFTRFEFKGLISTIELAHQAILKDLTIQPSPSIFIGLRENCPPLKGRYNYHEELFCIEEVECCYSLENFKELRDEDPEKYI